LKKVFVYLTFLSLIACASVPIENLHTEIKTDNWVVGFEKDFGPGKGYIREFVPKGESIFEWSRLISVEFIEGESKSPTAYITAFQLKRKEQCPGTIFEVISQNQYFVTYLFNFPACMKHDAQSEISRLYKGNDGLHRLSYTEKSLFLSESEKKRWLSEFEKSYIVKGQ
jgi:hypothetical protein